MDHERMGRPGPTPIPVQTLDGEHCHLDQPSRRSRGNSWKITASSEKAYLEEEGRLFEAGGKIALGWPASGYLLALNGHLLRLPTLGYFGNL